MKVAIAGAGKLGMAITEALLGGGHDITLIDKDDALMQRIASRFDVLTASADAKRVETLKDIGIEEYDLLISVVDDDDTNIVICALAKKLGCPKTIARVRTPEHAEQIGFIKKAMNIDHIVNPDMACAAEIYKYLVEKYTLADGCYTADGVSILEFDIGKVPGLVGQEVRFSPRILEGMLIGAISRSGKIIIPNGSTLLEAGDTLYVIGLERKVKDLARTVHDRKRYTDLSRVMIAGGGNTGYYLAQKLSGFGVSVKIIETDRARCEYLTSRLE
ncbi:MAG TPA: Trk system potassium transporter TrkA, partial [Clostridiales bacterium]|nr:Trk system potassium transporter TrkA [Clostridiales bacterium]